MLEWPGVMEFENLKQNSGSTGMQPIGFVILDYYRMRGFSLRNLSLRVGMILSVLNHHMLQIAAYDQQADV